MDGQRFDDLARKLAFSTSRRRIVQSAAGAAAGGLLSAIGFGRWVSADQTSDNEGAPDPTVESPTGVPTEPPLPTPEPTQTPTPLPTEPPATATAAPVPEEGEPTPAPIDPALCDAGVVCANACVDPTFDPAHCGSCGAACAGGQTCQGGACGCPEDTAWCDGCVNPFCDPTNCGGCGVACGAGDVCMDGACTSAPDGWAEVSVLPTGAWVDTGVDVVSGSVVRLWANGTVRVAADGAPTPPVGRPGCLAPVAAPAPDLACAALVGRVGPAAPFEVGLGTGFVAPDGGRLWLAVNAAQAGRDGRFTAYVLAATDIPAVTPVTGGKTNGPVGGDTASATSGCASSGSTCAVNADCCSNVCVNGSCRSSSVSLGGTCDESADCVSGLLCRSSKCCKDVPLACAANGDCCSGACVGGTCCKPVNTSCAASSDCCSGASCTGGTCCKPTNGTCTANSQCCSGVCVNETCKVGPIALGGTCDESADCTSGLLCRSGKCCKDIPLACSTNADCCSGVCLSGNCCKPTNTSCTANADCCSGVCVNGTCASGPVALGGTCDQSADCTSDLLCRSGKCCKDVPLACAADGDCCSGACQNGACCKPNGTSCTTSANCCSGICTNGTCEAAAIGGSCDDARDCDSESVCSGGACCRAEGAACTSSADCCAGGCFDDVCVGAVGVRDITAEADCEIEYLEYTDDTFTTVVTTSGSLTCGTGTVVHSFPMAQVSAAVVGDYEYVELTGNDSADRESIETLVASLLPVDNVPVYDGGDVEAASICTTGTYPAYYVVRGSYAVSKWDHGPLDTRVQFQAYYKRISCTRYELLYGRQWLQSATTQKHGLWWESLRYSRMVNQSYPCFCPNESTVCTKFPGAGGLNALIYYPKESCIPTSCRYQIRPNGLATFKTDNDGRDFCTFWGETWTGSVYLYGPAS